MSVIWLIVALVTWPVLALVIGMFLGRGMAAGSKPGMRLSAATWLRRDVPREIVAPLPSHLRDDELLTAGRIRG